MKITREIVRDTFRAKQSITNSSDDALVDMMLSRVDPISSLMSDDKAAIAAAADAEEANYQEQRQRFAEEAKG